MSVPETFGLRAAARTALPTAAAWRGRRVLLTGHTGFKGSWLAWWLIGLGAEVHGLALAPPSSPSLFELANLAHDLRDLRADIRDAIRVADIVRDVKPEVVIHLAAQSIVRRSYLDPLGTLATNVMGTAHVLDAIRTHSSVQAVVIASSDKCYRNEETGRAYVESDALGGRDPYSASKGCAEIVTDAYRATLFPKEPSSGTLVASVRAGNVIGGGDWAEDRLVPDLVRARATGTAVRVRNPRAIRPWQHVLEPLAGYLLVAEALMSNERRAARAFNFGPLPSTGASVQDLITAFHSHWSDRPKIEFDHTPQPHEAGTLNIDASAAMSLLGWSPRWSVTETVAHTAQWYAAVTPSSSPDDVRRAMTDDLVSYTTPPR